MMTPKHVGPLQTLLLAVVTTQQTYESQEQRAALHSAA
jgi:hypothetical protein